MTLDQFREAAQVPSSVAQRWHAAIHKALLEFDIATAARMAAFVAQTGHETLGFTLTLERWGPTPAQQGYEPPSRKASDLGNLRAGDGRLFRGRGLIQITGRANYMACGKALAIDLEHQPELLESECLAARSAAWWWERHGCNQLVDKGDFVALTKRINGGTNGLDDRLRRWAIAKTALGV